MAVLVPTAVFFVHFLLLQVLGVSLLYSGGIPVLYLFACFSFATNFIVDKVQKEGGIWREADAPARAWKKQTGGVHSSHRTFSLRDTLKHLSRQPCGSSVSQVHEVCGVTQINGTASNSSARLTPTLLARLSGKRP